MVLSAITTLRSTKSKPLLDTRSVRFCNVSPPIFENIIRPRRDKKQTFSTESYLPEQSRQYQRQKRERSNEARIKGFLIFVKEQ